MKKSKRHGEHSAESVLEQKAWAACARQAGVCKATLEILEGGDFKHEKWCKRRLEDLPSWMYQSLSLGLELL